MNEIKERLKSLSERLEKAFSVLNLESERTELKKLQDQASAEGFWDNVASAQEVMQKVGLLSNKLSSWDQITSDINDLTELASDTNETDHEMVSEITSGLMLTEKQFEILEFGLLFTGAHDTENAIVSISAGSGGVDAQDWAEMLGKMFLKFAEKNSFKATILSETAGDEAGIKGISFQITGPYAYGYLKSEHGVHRLVRISPYDAAKARHTSFALVEVVPEVISADYKLDEKELRIDVYRSGGNGGQSVNTTDSAVRITHLPTGLTATCQNERSQLQNKETAMKVLVAKLVDLEEKQLAAELASIKGETISAEWGNQIRSYVLQPYTLVKDHRTGYETGDVQKVLEGGIDEFIEAYLRSIIS
jgi:peptide chain release factor 2